MKNKEMTWSECEEKLKEIIEETIEEIGIIIKEDKEIFIEVLANNIASFIHEYFELKSNEEKSFSNTRYKNLAWEK
jgi:hypothetical protein